MDKLFGVVSVQTVRHAFKLQVRVKFPSRYIATRDSSVPSQRPPSSWFRRKFDTHGPHPDSAVTCLQRTMFVTSGKDGQVLQVKMDKPSNGTISNNLYIRSGLPGRASHQFGVQEHPHHERIVELKASRNNSESGRLR